MRDESVVSLWILIVAEVCGFRLNITMVGLFSSDVRYLPGYQYMTPVYEVAAKELAQDYDFSVQFYPITGADIRVCEDVLANLDLLWDFYFRTCDRTSLFVVVGPSCEEVVSIGLIAKEFRFLVLPMVTAVSQVKNRAKFPTVVSFAPLDYDIGTAIMTTFFALHNWTRIAVVWDTNIPRTPTYNIYSTALKNRNAASGFPLNLMYFPVRMAGNVSFADILSSIRKVSRIVLLLLHQDDIRGFMIAAANADMTSVEYMYFTVLPFAFHRRYGTLAWQKNDADDPTARQAFGRLLQLCMSCPEMDLRLLQPTLETIKASEMSTFNVPYEPQELPHMFARAGYFSVKILGQVLNEMLLNGSSTTDAAQTATHFYGRTFVVRGVSLQIDHNGFLVPASAFRMLNNSTGAFESVLQIDSTQSSLSQYFVPKNSWARFGDDWHLDIAFPLNEPVCGYTNDKLACIKSDGTQNVAAVSAAAAVILLILFGAVGYGYLHRRRNNSLSRREWTLELGQLRYISRAVRRRSLWVPEV